MESLGSVKEQKEFHFCSIYKDETQCALSDPSHSIAVYDPCYEAEDYIIAFRKVEMLG